MKRNIFVDPDIGNTLKKFTMYFSVFFLVFGLTMIIRNAGDTYALDGKNCPLGWPWNSDYNRCVSTNTFSTLDICKSAIETLGREYDEEGGNTCIKLNSTNTEWTGLIYSQCTVNFNANGGSVSPTSKTVNCGETVTVPTPTKSGYVFDKWYYYTNLGTVTNEVEKGGKVTVDVDGMDLVAGWIEEEVEEKVTVTFDAKSGYFKYNGTKLSDSSRKFQINKGDSIILISTDSSKTMTTIHRDDYKFDGWSESSTSCDSVLSGGKEVQNVTAGFDELHDIGSNNTGENDLFGEIYKPQLSKEWEDIANKIGDFL